MSQTKKEKRGYQPIENYGIIGDLRTVALVGLNGSIDFMCFPDFDSPSIFASLLDDERGGFFEITPVEENVKNKQMYLPDSNILLTRFLFVNGIGEITDFMPISALLKKNVLIRKVTNIKGKITYRMRCCPRFNYARSPHHASLHNNEIIFKSQGSDRLVLKLKSFVPLQIRNGDGFAEFTLNPNETVSFLLENIQEGQALIENEKEFTEAVFNQTLLYWRNWVAKSTYNGRWREMVHRSALVLKLLISNKYGSIIAAPTFSLPEKVGGEKNWDYRYSWIRDAAFTIYALMRLGYFEEAEGFIQWIQGICFGKKGTLNLVYGIDGRKKLPEKILSNLKGYKNSSPVRIGNAAYSQSQLDIYGEFMDSLYLYDKFVNPVSYDTWSFLTKQVDWLLEHWKKKDQGIWEIRTKKEAFLYSRVMSWVAVDRTIRLGNKRSFPINPNWVKVRDQIYHSVFNDFWNEKKEAFVQFKGSHLVDASCLFMPLVRFISPKDPRWLSTMRCVERELVVDSLVYRYAQEQEEAYGFKKGEGTFSLCSFPYTECLSRAGETQKARLYFEKMLSYANHLGLYSEQLGFQGEYLGNFPQAFTHLALISAAFDLDRRLDEKKTT